MNKARLLAREVLTDPVHFVAFGFGTGLSPWAPGTVGSMVGILLAFLTMPLDRVYQAGIAALLVAAGIWICGESARRIGIHDHGGIVWDELTGMYITLLAVPPSPPWWLLAFIVFRAFDIIKPWPIRDLDHRLGGGLGIMLDDLGAALYAVVLFGLYRWFMS